MPMYALLQCTQTNKYKYGLRLACYVAGLQDLFPSDQARRHTNGDGARIPHLFIEPMIHPEGRSVSFA